MTDILARLSRFVAATYYRDESRAIGQDAPLVSTGVIDSFGLVDLSLFVENEFGVRLDAAELGAGRADTPREIAELVASKLP